MLLLDLFPAKSGTSMLIPKKHVDYFFDLDDGSYSALFMTAKRLSEVLRRAMNAKRIGIAIVGFEVPHAHLHLIPLHGPNEMFDPAKFVKASHEELRTAYEKIKKEMQS